MTRRNARPDPVLRKLIALGMASLPLYLFVTVLSWSFRYGEGHKARPLLAVTGLFLFAWLGYALALATVLKQPHQGTSESNPAAERQRLFVVLGFSVVFRLILMASSPIQEIDYYRYLWDGRMLLSGMNPFVLAPAEIDRLGPWADSSSLPGRAWQLTQESDSVRIIFSRIHHREVPTIYPPVSQLVFALSAWLTPAGSPLWAHVAVLKGLLIAFDIGAVIGLAGLLARTGRPASWCLAYGWCPLVLKEIANTAHLDAIAVCFTVFAAFALARIPARANPVGALGDAVLGAAALGAATLAKSYPLVLVPLAGAFLARRLRARALIAAAVFVLVLLAGYLPFLFQEARVQGVAKHSPFTGFGTFLSRWQKNDFLFMLAHENLRPPVEGQAQHGFVIVPGSLRTLMSSQLGQPITDVLGASQAEPAFLLTQLLLGSLVLGIVAVWSWRIYRGPEVDTLLRGIALVLVWGWLLSATPHPWYLTWCIPFLVFERRRSWFLLTATAFLYYLRFWLEYQALSGGPLEVATALEQFDYRLVWFEYLPVFFALLLESRCRRPSVIGIRGLSIPSAQNP